MSEKIHYGGQAVIEGVMIRGKKHIAIAVRCPNDEINLHTEPLQSLFTGRLRRVPLIRGVIALLEVLIIGTRALMRSASVALGEEPGESYSILLWATMALGLAVGIGIFFVLPVFAQEWLDSYIGSSALLNLIEGAIRLAMFLGYLKLIGMMKDVKRVFAYHGAEHMTIHALEQGDPLEVESVKKYTTLHPRCGTAFLLVVMVVAILVFVALGQPALWIRIVSRVALLPVIAAIAYEIIRYHGAHSNNRLLGWILAPSLALQWLTTRKPDEKQIEVAIHAVKGALRADGVSEESLAEEERQSPEVQTSSAPRAEDPSPTE
ncbi:MAG: DUF1385 domain-containing protein [Dehalococcoidia bacterium]